MLAGNKGFNIAAMQSSLHHNEEMVGEAPPQTVFDALTEGVLHYILIVWMKSNLLKHFTLGVVESLKSLGANLQLKPSIVSETDKNFFGLKALGSMPSESSSTDGGDGGGGGDDGGDDGGGDVGNNGYDHSAMPQGDYDYDYDSNAFPNSVPNAGEDISAADQEPHEQIPIVFPEDGRGRS